MYTKLIWKTENAEQLILYIARISNPKYRSSSKAGLIKYCLDNGHVSPFEMANLCFEVETTVRIAPQILRHKSLHFQQYSQRYSKAPGFETIRPRRQDKTNRQNSFDDLPDEAITKFISHMDEIQALAWKYYEEALSDDVAKESAAFLLPGTTTTRICINGVIRDWIFYIKLREGNGTQKEHVDIAKSIKEEFIKQLPIISEALGWKGSDNGE